MIPQGWSYNPVTKDYTNQDLNCSIIWNHKFSCWQLCHNENSWFCTTLQQAFEEAYLP